MPQVLRIFTAILLLTLIAPTAEADNNAVIKLARGLENILTSPVEIPAQYVYLANEKHTVFQRIIATPVYGIGKMLGRILGGAYEMVTFILPIPSKYKPLMDPPTPIGSWKEALNRQADIPDQI